MNTKLLNNNIRFIFALNWKSRNGTHDIEPYSQPSKLFGKVMNHEVKKKTIAYMVGSMSGIS